MDENRTANAAEKRIAGDEKKTVSVDEKRIAGATRRTPPAGGAQSGNQSSASEVGL